MPQMAPIMWSVLLIMFCMALMVFMTKLYFYSAASSPTLGQGPLSPQETPWPW
uniref:ATP synthase complex subunit 8 n=1 Tax=Asellus aquaticus TaxID=92525 RepID=E3SX73_ASEAQ|nr:ATP synthase F0 subunit 8 [Asellus aquaticus]